MSCSLSVVVCLGSRENASNPNASRGRCVKMLGESIGMLQMDLVILMRGLCSFLMPGTKNG